MLFPRLISPKPTALRFSSILMLLAALACAPAEDSPSPSASPEAENSAPSGTDAPAAAEAVAIEKIDVATLSYPVDWLVRRLGGDLVSARLVIPRGEEPTFWRPSADVIIGLQDADLIVMNGAGYEAWTGQANLPLSRLVETASDLDLIQSQGRTHSHGDGGEHSHASLDPHTWMDPDLYLEQARRIHGALAAAMEEAASAQLDANLRDLERELLELSDQIEQAVAPLRGIKMAANHPSYGYLARRFSLDIEVVDLDAQTPNEHQIARLTAWATGQDRPILLWTEEPSPEALAALPSAALSASLDPLEQPAPIADEYDYLAQMRTHLEAFGELSAQLGPASR